MVCTSSLKARSALCIFVSALSRLIFKKESRTIYFERIYIAEVRRMKVNTKIKVIFLTRDINNILGYWPFHCKNRSIQSDLVDRSTSQFGVRLFFADILKTRV